MRSLTGRLHQRAQETPDRVAFRFQSYRPAHIQELTWGQLWSRSQAIAQADAGLTRGQAVLLLYAPGLDFHSAFFGAMLAGAQPVAVQAPNPNHRVRTLAQLKLAQEACQTDTVWTTASLCQRLSLGWPTDARSDPTEAPWSEPSPQEIAYLQLTSGTTSPVRPVAISHANAVWMGQAIVAESEVKSSTALALGWLPLFHDLGLVLQLLCPLLAPGGRGHIMAPLDFVQRPQRWLEALCAEKASHTAAPNFAYQLCLDQLGADFEVGDLSCLRRAFNGGEAVSAHTVEQFRQRFGVELYPCYGLAEATLMVSGARRAIQSHPTAVSCGPPLKEVEVDIRQRQIWVRSPGVAPAEADRQGWLNTGDLGFVQGGELFVTGREKELLVLRGVNYAPQWLEEATGFPAVAFSVHLPQGEVVVLQVEVPRDMLRREGVAEELRSRILEVTGIGVHSLHLVAPGRLPRTTSGKLQRGLCRTRYLEADHDQR